MSAIREEVFVEEGMIQLGPRVARIESDVETLKETVVRLDKRLDERFDKLDGKIDSLDAKLGGKIGSLDAKLDGRFKSLDDKLDGKISSLDGTVNGIDKKVAVLEHGFDEMIRHQESLSMDLRDLRRSLDAKFIWIVTTMIAFGAALLAAMAKGFHWLK